MMTFHFNKDFKILSFYTYPTCVVDRFVEYSDIDKSNFNNDYHVMDFFNDCLKEVEKKENRHMMDNKIAIKVMYKPTGSIFYVGYKDNIYCIGLDLNKYMTGRKIEINI